MKKWLQFLTLTLLIISLVFPLVGCSNMRKAAYRATHDTSAVDPDKLEGIFLIHKKDNTILTNVIDLEYDDDKNQLHYVRRSKDNKYVKGIVSYDDVDIRTKEGRLLYKDDEWYYTDLNTNRTYLVNQDQYIDIVVSGEDTKK